MYLQGDLQTVFDALYNLGIIDPVLDADWTKAMDELPYYSDQVSSAIKSINSSQGNITRIISELEKYEDKVLSFIAMEVAKEFADYHAREEVH